MDIKNFLNENENSWDEWGKHVLLELTRINETMIDMQKDVNNIDKKLATTQTELKLKAGIFGFIGSIIPVTIMIILALIKGVL